MGFDFFGADVSMSIYLQPGVQLNPGRYSIDSNGQRVQNPPDADIVTLGMRSSFLQTDPASQQVLLTNGGLDQNVAPLDFLRSMMTKFEMEIGMDMLPKITVELDPPTNDMALAMLNSNLFTVGNVLAVKFGYTKSPFEAYPGRGKDAELFFLLKPDIKFGDALSFTLMGLSVGFAIGQRENTRRQYRLTSPASIASDIAIRNGKTLVTSGFAEASTADSASDEVAATTGVAAVQSPSFQAWNAQTDWEQWESDWEFLQRILDSIPGKLTFRLEGDKIYIFSFIDQMQASPKAIFRWYHGAKLNAKLGQFQSSDQIPIFKASSDTTMAFLPATAGGIVMNTGIGRDKRDVPGANNNNANAGQDVQNNKRTTLVPTMGDRTVTSPDQGNNPALMVGKQRTIPWGAWKGMSGAWNVTQAPVTSPSTIESSRNLAQEAEFYGNFNITVETLGVPTLRPGDLFEVKGFETVGNATEKLNGKFLIKKMVHTIGSDGFTTTITGIRNSTPGEGIKTGGAVNTKSQVAPSGSLDFRPIPADVG